MMCVRMYVRMCPSRLGMLADVTLECRGVTHAGLGNSECHVCVCMALAVGVRSRSLASFNGLGTRLREASRI